MKRRILSFIVAAVMMFTTVFAVSPADSKAESGDAFSNPIDITFGTSVNGVLTDNGADKYYYRFTIPSTGNIKITGSFSMEYVNFYIYNNSADEVWSDTGYYWNSTTEVITVDESVYLTQGTYYFCVSREYRSGNYNFKIDFTSSGVTQTTPQPGQTSQSDQTGGSSTIQNATQISANGTSYTGQISQNNTKAFYKFTISQAQSVVFSGTFEFESVYFKVYDDKYNEIKSYNPYWNSTSKIISFSEVTSLSAGTYYISISKDYGYGKYSFSVNILTQANCPHKEYSTSYVDATYFNRGYTLHTCDTCGYSYKDEYVAKKRLDTPDMNTPGRYDRGKHSINISWSWSPDADGYQIKWSGKKKMSGAKKKKITKTFGTIKNLSSHKKYYIQVRAYVKSGGKKAYSSWSNKVKAKTL